MVCGYRPHFKEIDMNRTCYWKLETGNRCGKKTKGTSSLCLEHKRAYSKIYKPRRRAIKEARGWEPLEIGVPKDVMQKAMKRVVPCDIAEQLEIVRASTNFKKWPKKYRQRIWCMIPALWKRKYSKDTVRKLAEIDCHMTMANSGIIKLSIARLEELVA